MSTLIRIVNGEEKVFSPLINRWVRCYRLNDDSLITVPEIQKHFRDKFDVEISTATARSRLKQSRDKDLILKPLRVNPRTHSVKTKTETKYGVMDSLMKFALKNI